MICEWRKAHSKGVWFMWIGKHIVWTHPYCAKCFSQAMNNQIGFASFVLIICNAHNLLHRGIDRIWSTCEWNDGVVFKKCGRKIHFIDEIILTLKWRSQHAYFVEDSCNKSITLSLAAMCQKHQLCEIPRLTWTPNENECYFEKTSYQ